MVCLPASGAASVHAQAENPFANRREEWRFCGPPPCVRSAMPCRRFSKGCLKTLRAAQWMALLC